MAESKTGAPRQQWLLEDTDAAGATNSWNAFRDQNWNFSAKECKYLRCLLRPAGLPRYSREWSLQDWALPTSYLAVAAGTL